MRFPSHPRLTPILILAAALAALWCFSRAAVLVIDRSWPPLGRMLRIDGLDLHVVDIPAPPRAPIVLLIHGASGNLREPLAAFSESLRGRYRLVAIDRPGHGHSSRGGREMSDPGRQADLIAEVLDRLGAAPAIVLGHSWGASVAAALAQRHPQAVSGLVLVAPATHPWPGGVSSRSRFFALPYVGRFVAELFVAPLGLILIGPALELVFAPDPVPLDYRRVIGAPLAIRPKTFVANARDVVDLYAHLVRLSARYDEIRAPTEIVTGDRDATVSPEIHSYGLARDIPGAALTILPGAGHMPHWSHIAEVVAALDRVAQQSAGPAQARAAE